MPYAELDHERIAIFRAMSGNRADRYIGEMLLPALQRAMGLAGATIRETRLALECPYRCLRAIYGHYAFNRRGRDKNDLSFAALEALRQTCGTQDALTDFLKQGNAQRLWSSFEAICTESGGSKSAESNCGLVAGMAELAQEISKGSGNRSIVTWVVQGIQRTRKLEPQFIRMVDVRGVGPKMVSLFLRDVVLLYGLEDVVEPSDRLFTVPIDKWLRTIAPYVVDEVGVHEMPDWVLAGKITKYSRRAGVSAIRFTMGTTFFGIREARDLSSFESKLTEVANPQFSLQ